MSGEEEQSQTGLEDSSIGGPGAPTPLSALEGVNGLSTRDIQLVISGGYNTVESVAYTYAVSRSRHSTSADTTTVLGSS